MSQIQIPKGWKVLRLDEIAEIGQGGTPSRANPEYWNGDIPWLRSGELLNNRIRKSEEKISKLGLANSSAKLLPKNTILIAMTGQGLTRGRTGLLEIEASANQSCAHLIINNENISAEYVWQFLQSKYWFIRSINHGSGQPGINTSLIKQLKIPIPPSKEIQKKIVQKLDHVLRQLEEKKREVIKFYDHKKIQNLEFNTKKQIIHNALLGKTTEDWRKINSDIISAATRVKNYQITLKKRYEIAKNEKQKKLKEPENLFDNLIIKEGKISKWAKIPFVTFCVLQRGFDLPKKDRISGVYPLVSSSGVSDYISKFKIKGPGVVTGRSGSIGSVTYIKNDFWPLNTTLYVKDFNGNIPKFVYYFLLDFNFREFASSTAVLTLNRNNFFNILVDIPPIEEQIEIVHQIENRLKKLIPIRNKIDLILQNKKASLSKISLASNSILNSAFSGKLVN